MSLRADNGSGRTGRSRSRNRSKDERPSSPPKKVSSSSKNQKKPRFEDVVDDDETSNTPRSAAFDLESGPKYEERTPAFTKEGPLTRSVAPAGQSSRQGNDSDDDDLERDGRRQPSRYEDYGDYYNEHAHPPLTRGMTMPSMPDYDARPPLLTSSKRTNSYPTRGPAYPVDESPAFAMMPQADYGHLNYTRPDPASPSGKSKPIKGRQEVPDQFESRSPPNSAGLYGMSPPESRSPPNTDGLYGISPPSRTPHSPPRSKPSAYTAELREFKPPSKEKAADSRGRSSSNRLSTADSKYVVRAPSPGGLHARMNSLSVSGSHAQGGAAGSGLPPPSPLLEAYKGTYQSISPMPSPPMLALDREGDIGDVDDLMPLSPRESNRPGSKDDGKPQKRRARIYEPESDAKIIYDALNHRRHAENEPLLQVLPLRDHDQIQALRDTYRKTYKYSGAKIDMTKHIKMMTEGNFGKICFVTASGRWKSEAYWANCWYQSHAASRELLIESLMGRTNAEIREIKKAFRDKKYDDDLERCMRKELKPDKFRDAILQVLKEERQEETESWGVEYVQKDMNVLRMALVTPQGGESTILKIVCGRSEKHLSEVLQLYETNFRTRFAKDALDKSPNLVGEVIAHILNGVINKPQRDMSLLHHALEDISSKNKAVELRYELLMSRLVRIHWDAKHLALVKQEYRRRYKVSLEDHIDDATKGDFKEFCIGLCEI